MATLRIEGLPEDVFRAISAAAFLKDISIRDEMIFRLQWQAQHKQHERWFEELHQRLERANA